jgi:hypothetical protein
MFEIEVLSFSHMITSTLQSSHVITPNVQVYAIIQPDDNISVIIWLRDKDRHCDLELQGWIIMFMLPLGWMKTLL